MKIFPLAKQTVLVTGAGGGIGSAVALELARRGASLVLHTGHHTSALETLRRKIVRVINQNCQWCQSHDIPPLVQKIWTHQVDFAIFLGESEKSEKRERWNILDDFCDQVWRETGGVQSVVACAGSDILTNGAAKRTFDQRLESLIAVDLRATTHLVRWFGQRMRAAAMRSVESVTLVESFVESESDSVSADSAESVSVSETNMGTNVVTKTVTNAEMGIEDECSSMVTATSASVSSIVLIGWSGVERGLAGNGGELFGAVKGAIHGFGRSLALSLAPEVRVNVIAPGWIRTAWGQQVSLAWQRQVLNETALRRWGTPEDIATTAAFLISSDAAFLTGCILPVDGGYTTRPEF